MKQLERAKIDEFKAHFRGGVFPRRRELRRGASDLERHDRPQASANRPLRVP
jgi:hypothetical protein